MSKLLIQGKFYDPIKVGDEGDWYVNNQDAVCGDCGTKYDIPDDIDAETLNNLIALSNMDKKSPSEM